jgi:hypothetical protein
MACLYASAIHVYMFMCNSHLWYCMQVRAGLWRRNGQCMIDQASLETSLCVKRLNAHVLPWCRLSKVLPSYCQTRVHFTSCFCTICILLIATHVYLYIFSRLLPPLTTPDTELCRASLQSVVQGSGPCVRAVCRHHLWRQRTHQPHRTQTQVRAYTHTHLRTCAGT